MFQRQNSNSPSRRQKREGGGKSRRSRRRQIVPPELLERRDAPGAISCSFMPVVTAAPLLTDFTSNVSAMDGKGANHAAANIDSAKLCAENYPTAKSGEVNSSQSNSQEQAKANALAADHLLVPASVIRATDSLLAVKFPSVFDPQSANTEPASLPVKSTAAAASANRSSGGTSSAGGGGTSGGGGSAAPAAIRSTAASATSVAVPQFAAIKAAAVTIIASPPVITVDDVGKLLDRASAATPRNDAIIAIVDREGNILGVRVESGVPISPGDTQTLVFAIDGAVAEARTAAFFSNDQAPLTSRTVRFISQSTVTQREVESNPNIADMSSTVRGPGFVAPIGIGGHFPPGVANTAQVDLFAIEHSNRDSVIFPGLDGIKGTSDDINLGTRYGANFDFGKEEPAPESYGYASGLLPNAQDRGIGTLPGGIPLFKADPSAKNTPKLVGGIGVFFPGPNGYATYEQNFQTTAALKALGKKDQTTDDRLNAPLVLEAEYTAYAAAGGVGTIAGVPLPAGYSLPTGRIDLAGITLEIYGPHPKDAKGLVAFGKALGTGTVNGVNMQVTPGGTTLLVGTPVPDGWLVSPHAAADGSLSAADVTKIINDGIAEANKVRAAIRLPIGQRTKMVFCVTDLQGNILGLYRMPDATVFSIDIAVAKARNVAYYDDPTAIQTVDRVDANFDGTPEVPAGASFTARTFRYLSTPFFPTGVDGTPPGPFSLLNDHTATSSIDPKTAENIGPPLPANQFKSVLGYDAFNPDTNFRELSDPNAVVGNQNGVVFFPGSTALYKNGKIVGGLGVSGDGVDQDDVVTSVAAGTFVPGPTSGVLRADQVLVRGVRLPYFKFPRNPHA